MRRKLICCITVFLIIQGRGSGDSLDTIISCPSGYCPVVEGKKDDYLTGRWECGVCGVVKTDVEKNKPFCNYAFQTFEPTQTGCAIRHKICPSLKCVGANTTRCEEIYLTGACCICKDDIFGNTCNLPPKVYIASTIFRGKGELVEWRNRPECWVAFTNHNFKWKTGLWVTLVFVPWKERVNKLPFNVYARDQIRNYIFTKFNAKISKNESEHWCLTSTTLGDYCQRFNLIFDPKFNIVKENVRHFIHVEVEFVYESYFLAVHNSKIAVYQKNGKTIGYTTRTEMDVFPFTLLAPYYRYKVFHTDGVEISYDKITVFNNQTEVDSTCVPNIQQLCQTVMRRDKTFSYWTLTFKMEYRPPPPVCKETSIAQWRVFKKAPNTMYKPGDEILYREGCCTVSFPPYTFKIGTIFIRFTMMHIQGGKKVYNSKYCVKPIYNDKIKANFDQVKKIVNTEEVNYVEVHAFDINNPPKEQKNNLVYLWNCTFNGTTEPCNETINLFRKITVIEIPPNRLKVNCTYNFSVLIYSTTHVYGIEDDTDGWAYQVLEVTTGERNFISLVCTSCDKAHVANPQEYNFIMIRASDGVSPPYPADYDWTYAEITATAGQEDFRSVVDIRLGNDTSNIVLKIKKDVLGLKKEYVFKAVRRNTRILAQIRITTPGFKGYDQLNCTLDPLEGIQGWTDFSVECQSQDEALFYEFYDKEENDELIFNGRMIGFNDEGALSNFKMTRGKFYVLAFDGSSLRMIYSMMIKLTPYNDNLKYLEKLLNRIRPLLDTDQFDRPCATASSVADVMTREMKPPSNTVGQPILILHSVRLVHAAGLMKMLLASLKIVLTNTARKFDILEQEAFLTNAGADTLSTVSHRIMHYLGSDTREPTLTRLVYYDVVKVVLDCAEILLGQRNKEFMNETEDYTKPSVVDLVQATSLTLVSVLDIASHTLMKQLFIGDMVKEVVSEKGKLITVSKIDFALNIINWSSKTETCSVIISNGTLNFMGNPFQWENELLILQYIRIFLNPLWWAGGNVVSEVILVNVCQKTINTGCLKMTRFNRSIALKLKVIEPLDFIIPLEGTTNQVNPKTSQEQKDLDLTVYRLFLPERAKLYLKFLLNGTEEFRVMLIEGLRPDYETMVKYSTIINATSPEYLVTYKHKNQDEKVYYLGILPGKSVSVGEKVSFRLKAYYILCTNWMKWSWGSFGCWVGINTNDEWIHCDCDHILSVTAGVIAVPDHNLSKVSEFSLYLTPWVNLVPFVALLIIVLLYLLLLIWAMLMYKKDSRSCEVIVLNDNFPGEPYAYLIGVHTGSKINSGTTAKVGISLIGEVEASRPHILTSPDRKVLRVFSEDWFLIYTPRYLGRLNKLWLWHNDEGVSSDWYIDIIEVHDLKEGIQYIFNIKAWIAMEAFTHPEALIAPMKMIDYVSASNVFHRNFMSGMRDTQNWTSVFLKHPRNPMSRVERASFLLSFVMLAMAVSLLLYLFHFGFLVDEDKPSYYLDKTDLLIFIISLITASIITCLIEGLFRKSLTYKYSPQAIRRSRFSDSSVFKLDMFENFGRKKTIYERIRLGLFKIVRGGSLLPVRMPHTKSDLVVRKLWFCAAWILCITTILICAFFIILYSWKLPSIKIEKFLTIFLAVVFFDALVLSTLKILLFSVFLSWTFRTIQPDTIYHFKIQDGKRWHLFGDETFLASLLETRKQKAYYPLREWEKETKRERKIIEYRWKILLEFLMVVILVCVICAICSMTFVERLRSNTHATRMMTTSASARVPDLRQVFNRTQLFEFLEKTYVSRLHRYLWYNYDPLNSPNSIDRDWTSDCVTRLLGDTRIRQLRVSSQYCSVNRYFKESIESCAPPWSETAEEQDDFGTGWIPADYEDVTREKSIWRYTDAESANSSRAFGHSGTLYGSDGYIVETGLSKRDARYTLYSLNIKDWLDHLTRAVFIELTIYNVNTKLITQVVLVCEQHPSGLYISFPNVESVYIDVAFDFWNIGFIIFQIFFLLRALYQMNRNGVFVYLSRFSNCYELFLLTLGIFTVVLYVACLINSSIYMEDYYRKGLHEFFNFFEVIRYNFTFNTMIFFLFLCVVGKLIFSWRFGEIYYRFYYTFNLSLSWIFWVTSYFAVCIVYIPWRLASYRVYVYTFSHYSTAIAYPKDYKSLLFLREWKDCLLVCFICIVSSIVMLLFIAQFVHFYRASKLYKPLSYYEIDHFSFINFIKGSEKLTGKK